MSNALFDSGPTPGGERSSSAILAGGIQASWRTELADVLAAFVAVPSISPAFDQSWSGTGALTAIVDLVAGWLEGRASLPVTAHRHNIQGRTPLLIAEIPAFHDDGASGDGRDVLVYGHLDVQPAGPGWTVTHPFAPVRRDSLLYGRGTGDDKYVPLAVVSALEALRSANQPHPRVILLLEASEESSSVDLPAHLDAHGDLLGRPDVIVCLDTFVPDTHTLWHSSSMRGIVVADLTVGIATEGMHSGMVGGVAPSSFRLLRALLDRLEDSSTGICVVPEFHAQVPAEHRIALLQQAQRKGRLSDGLPLLPGVRPQAKDAADQLLAQSWEPSVAYVGIDGMPSTSAAGSVLRPATTVRMSVRLPPTVRASDAVDALRALLEADPPAGATVRLDVHGAEDGWSATIPAGLRTLLDEASAAGYGSPASECGGGATIPPLSILSRRFPEAAVVPLGLVTPTSNPHGPDENIDIDAAGRLTTALARLFASQG